MEDTFLIIPKEKLEAAIRDSDNSDRKIAYGAVLRTSPSFSLPAVQAAAREYAEKWYDHNEQKRSAAYLGFQAAFQWIAEQSKKGK